MQLPWLAEYFYSLLDEDWDTHHIARIKALNKIREQDQEGLLMSQGHSMLEFLALHIESRCSLKTLNWVLENKVGFSDIKAFIPGTIDRNDVSSAVHHLIRCRKTIDEQTAFTRNSASQQRHWKKQLDTLAGKIKAFIDHGAHVYEEDIFYTLFCREWDGYPELRQSACHRLMKQYREEGKDHTRILRELMGRSENISAKGVDDLFSGGVMPSFTHEELLQVQKLMEHDAMYQTEFYRTLKEHYCVQQGSQARYTP